VEQQATWRLDTIRGPVYLRASRQLPFGDDAEDYRELTGAAAGPVEASDGRGPSQHAGMIERIEKSQFSATRLKPGYDEEEVDKFLDSLVAALRRGELPEVRGARFSATRLRPGYVEQDVDALLDEVARYCDAQRR